MLSFILLLICFSSSKYSHVVEEHIDMIELNHFYDQKGQLVYDQIIFWERWPSSGKFHVRAWCLTDDKTENRRPIYNHEKEIWEMFWYDTNARLHRRLTTRIYRESWTQTDPERDDKKYHEERNRTNLIQKPEKSKTPEPSELIEQNSIEP